VRLTRASPFVRGFGGPQTATAVFRCEASYPLIGAESKKAQSRRPDAIVSWKRTRMVETVEPFSIRLRYIGRGRRVEKTRVGAGEPVGRPLRPVKPPRRRLRSPRSVLLIGTASWRSRDRSIVGRARSTGPGDASCQLGHRTFDWRDHRYRLRRRPIGPRGESRQPGRAFIELRRGSCNSRDATCRPGGRIIPL
jgi:hypothetical protein